MNNKIKLITTTSSIEGWSIKKYFGIVTYQLVIGANIFRDVFSSFRDILGGTAKGYQKDLQNMEIVALENLKKKASFLGANLILGLRLDFDEVSGGGKSMFMLSVSGTAAFGETDKEEIIQTQNEAISFEILAYELERDRLKTITFSESYSILNAKEIEKLIKFKVDIVEKVVNFIDNNLPTIDEHKYLLNEYFLSIPTESLNSFLKSDLFLAIRKGTFKRLLEILKVIDWFDYDVLFSLLKSDNYKAHIRAMYLLEYDKNYYSIDDVHKLNQLMELFCKTYTKYPVILFSEGMFGKKKEEWSCLNCGTLNSKDKEICSKHECQANVYGIPNDKINSEKLKKTYSVKINKLKELLGLI